jgi:hypothetical protein
MGPMGATVFFSWQADTPTGTGQNFLRKALEDACAAIASDVAVSDADRDLIVDSNTQGVAGHPPFVETIFKKIDGARVFVADMTLVAKRPDGGASPNPNVLIEYGWALKSLTHQQIICVMNAAYGEPSSEALPFDLRHMRWPFRYELAETATAEVRAEERGPTLPDPRSCARRSALVCVRDGLAAKPLNSLCESGQTRSCPLGHLATPRKETPNYPPQRQTVKSRVRCQFPETETRSL